MALALGAPAFGLLIAVGRVAGAARARAHRPALDRSAREPSESQLGLDIAEAFGRIWLLAGAIVVAGVVGGRSDGLAAALTICRRLLGGVRRPAVLSGRRGLRAMSAVAVGSADGAWYGSLAHRAVRAVREWNPAQPDEPEAKILSGVLAVYSSA